MSSLIKRGKQKESIHIATLVGVVGFSVCSVFGNVMFCISVLAAANIKMINDSETSHSSGQIESNVKQEKTFSVEVENKSWRRKGAEWHLSCKRLSCHSYFILRFEISGENLVPKPSSKREEAGEKFLR